MKKPVLIIALLLSVATPLFRAMSDELPITEEDRSFYPSAILQMDDKFSHHVALVEKSTHTLYLYENAQGTPKLVKKYRIATGKKTGDKQDEGDHKTPEGIYQVTSFLSEQELKAKYGDYSKIYGPGAFPLNYPNFLDARRGKSGGGIWVHSTDDDSRIEKGLDSKGCVVLSTQDIVDISRYVDIGNTSFVILHDIVFLKLSTWSKMRQTLQKTVDEWAQAWKTETFDDYIGFYSHDFKDSVRGNYQSYKTYKKAVFSNPGRPNINFNHISFLAFEDYVVAQMQQEYASETIRDTGKKTLFLVKDHNYKWKIVVEEWDRIPQPNVAFTPSMRFFKEKGK